MLVLLCGVQYHTSNKLGHVNLTCVMVEIASSTAVGDFHVFEVASSMLSSLPIKGIRRRQCPQKKNITIICFDESGVVFPLVCIYYKQSLLSLKFESQFTHTSCQGIQATYSHFFIFLYHTLVCVHLSIYCHSLASHMPLTCGTWEAVSILTYPFSIEIFQITHMIRSKKDHAHEKSILHGLFAIELRASLS